MTVTRSSRNQVNVLLGPWLPKSATHSVPKKGRAHQQLNRSRLSLAFLLSDSWHCDSYSTASVRRRRSGGRSSCDRGAAAALRPDDSDGGRSVICSRLGYIYIARWWCNWSVDLGGFTLLPRATVLSGYQGWELNHHFKGRHQGWVLNIRFYGWVPRVRIGQWFATVGLVQDVCHFIARSHI
jgi:hypothetical protein